MLSGVHSRFGVATVSSGSGLPDPDHVPTLWFRTTSPVFSAVRPVTGTAARPPSRMISLRVAGLLHPAANRGVHRVFGRLSLFPGVAAVSRGVLLPLEGFPPSSAVPCHHGLCPLAVLSHRCSNLAGSRCRFSRLIRIPTRASTSRLCSVDGSVPSAAVSDDEWPTLPWAFVSPPRSFDLDLALARSIATNSRAASADQSLFRHVHTSSGLCRRVRRVRREAVLRRVVPVSSIQSPLPRGCLERPPDVLSPGSVRADVAIALERSERRAATYTRGCRGLARAPRIIDGSGALRGTDGPSGR
jgi:hypothetical protein